MHHAEFGQGCGAVILEDFGHTQCTIGTGERIGKKNIREFLITKIRECAHLALLTVILNEGQVKAIGHGYEEAGLGSLSVGYSMIHIYVLKSLVLAY